MTQLEHDRALMRTALKAAEKGGATVPQLIEAHALAEKYRLTNVTADLRRAIRDLIPDPQNHPIAVSRTIGIGMITGLFTFYVLRYLTHNNVPR